MRLKSVEYTERQGTLQEWTLRGLTLEDINLLVGKNASGKSMILNIIHGVAHGIVGRRPPPTHEHFTFVFDENELETRYELGAENGKLVSECFTVDNEVKLERGPGGVGRIHAEKEGKFIEFQTPEDQLAIAARRDTLQHSFFEPMSQWADSLYFYAFGTPLGKDRGAVLTDDISGVDSKDPSQVVAIFHKGKRQFGDKFIDAVREDFKVVGYAIDDIGLTTPLRYMGMNAPISGSELLVIYVQEAGLPGITEQTEMSQGMFRALSLIIQIDYAVLVGTPSCILIDDIGEGLDFERSVNLIDVLIKKAKNSAVQLIMASNDSFVINHVPLEVCAFVDRQDNHVEIRNYANSREIFDRFQFTGLNNFDFLAFDYLRAEVEE
uniref:AAA domain-containing protein, putative AbiEii toxin, Type IV TA system n=1 Tax=Candidatus Kentrum sp. LFY TaxID=2126342 RepID=A0A450U7B5_9GAMM|nr:MAG: AAA domain-containing protein, putative AbiEii toxin, Type IV TA system [Candidatus Kentron sp. LFY]VFJ93544.1 MAG: AAA domain-containing protein, putative AbiEii toxin, Type IV TA system [Candidatus Kentron sp. LFY]